MIDLLWLVPALPLGGFLVLVLAGGRLPPAGAAAVGVGSVGLSALAALLSGTGFLAAWPGAASHRLPLWTLVRVGGVTIDVGLYLDALSLVMILVVTVVGFLIHLYSAEFMAGEEGYGRFFAYMNLFVASMVTLLLADDLLLLYVGWEGVGLCSYLLIGFWYRERANGIAAQKAFIVTRVGDAAMAVGLFLLLSRFGTLRVQELMEAASRAWAPGAGPAVAAAALLLAGALGKSAQLPLQTWLPDAMAGPTPVSALIHAATMVTAGVYLVARTHVLFTLAPVVQGAVAAIGAATLLLAGFSALAQRDIKRVLAYSTMSQIGYMFLALGAGAWSAAIFHFMTHAFFKALLFLAAGAVIMSLHHEHDIFRMGGLKRRLPLAFYSFLIGGAALSAVPLVTAGFYSKEMILSQAWAAGRGGTWLWAAGVLGAVLTSLYTFRLIFIVFFGEEGPHTAGRAGGLLMRIPLMLLAALSIVGGFVEMRPPLADWPLFSAFMDTALPPGPGERTGPLSEAMLLAVAMGASLLGILAAHQAYLRAPGTARALAETSVGGRLRELWLEGWGFDRLYDRLFVRPFVGAARADKDDVIDSAYDGVAAVSRALHGGLSRTETGRLRWYVASIAAGGALVVALLVLL